MTTKERFIEAWKESTYLVPKTNIKEVAEKLNMTYGSVRTTAYKYKLTGVKNDKENQKSKEN